MRSSEVKKKVIWIVNEYNGPNVGERTRQTVLSQHLQEKGYKVCIIAGSTDYKGGKNYLNKGEKIRQEKFDGSDFYIINTHDYKHNYGRVLVALEFQYKLWRLRSNIPKPDVIINNFAGLFGNIALKWKHKYGTKVIFEILDLWPELFVDMGRMNRNSPVVKWLYSLEHKSYREADGIIFSFQGGKDYIIDKGWSKEVGGDVDTSSIGYLNNGVDLATVDAQKNDCMLEDTDLDSSEFKVVYVGSVSAFNGLDVLLESAKILQDTGHGNIKILIYGYGNQENQLRQMAKDYKLSNVSFKGKLDKKYALNVMSRSDVNVFTFRDTPLLKYGTSPNKLFMYFASGKPVLSMIRPAYDLVEGNECGVSVNNDPQIVADAIVRFSQMSPDEYQKYCLNARKTAEKYDYKELVNALIEKIEG